MRERERVFERRTRREAFEDFGVFSGIVTSTACLISHCEGRWKEWGGLLEKFWNLKNSLQCFFKTSRLIKYCATVLILV